MASPHAGRVYAISGGASGIGLAAAQLLVKNGAAVSLADVNEAALTSAAKTIKQAFPDAKVLTHKLDVRLRPDVKAWITRTVGELGDLHGSVNMAGIIFPEFLTLDEVPDEVWDRIIGINLTGLMIGVSEQIKAMKSLPALTKGGRTIVNGASLAGLVGIERSSAYTASKHGVVGLTKSVAKEVGPFGIRINAVAPGLILTPMVTANYPDVNQTQNPIVQAGIIKRLGTAEEVAGLVAFLLCDQSSYITGQIYSIDGGYTA